MIRSASAVLAITFLFCLTCTVPVNSQEPAYVGTPSITYEELEEILAAPLADKDTAEKIETLATSYLEASNTGSPEGIRKVSTDAWFSFLTTGGTEQQNHSTPTPDQIRNMSISTCGAHQASNGTVLAFADRTFTDSGETKTFLIIARPSADGKLLLDLIFPEVILTNVRHATPSPLVSPDAPYLITAEELMENGLPPRDDLIFLPATLDASPQANIHVNA